MMASRAKKGSIDDLVQSVSCYNPRPLFLHGYLGPFVTVYFLLIYSWINHIGPVPDDVSVNATDAIVTEAIVNGSDSPVAGVTDDKTSDDKVAGSATLNDTSSTQDHSSLHDQEIWFITVAICVVLQILSYLFCVWSVHVKCFLAFNRVSQTKIAL